MRVLFKNNDGGSTHLFKNSDYGNDKLSVLLLGHRIFGRTSPQNSYRENYYSLHYVADGVGVFDNIEVKKGMGFIVCPNNSHTFATYEGSLMNHYWISFIGTSCEELLQKCGIESKNHSFFCPWVDEVIPVFDAAFKGDINSKKISSMFEGILKYVLSFHEGDLAVPSQTSKAKEYVRAAKLYIDSRYREKITSDDIAKNVNISSKYLYSLFLKYENQSLQSYIIKKRLWHAKELLKHSKVRICDIAKSVGYADPLHFSKIFTKYVGISPSDYRKNEHGKITL